VAAIEVARGVVLLGEQVVLLEQDYPVDEAEEECTPIREQGSSTVAIAFARNRGAAPAGVCGEYELFVDHHGPDFTYSKHAGRMPTDAAVSQ